MAKIHPRTTCKFERITVHDDGEPAHLVLSRLSHSQRVTIIGVWRDNCISPLIHGNALIDSPSISAREINPHSLINSTNRRSGAGITSATLRSVSHDTSDNVAAPPQVGNAKAWLSAACPLKCLSIRSGALQPTERASSGRVAFDVACNVGASACHDR